jgi:Zn-dependent protease
MDNSLQLFAIYALPILLAITLHEAAHAYVARYFGDSTAYLQGRMSLNPIRHIDPLGTILIPVLLYVAGSPFLFGYAKPVPINFNNLRKPKRDMAWVALAGPAANIVMAFLWMILSIVLGAMDFQGDFLLSMTQAGVLSNLVIFAFNLFPIPPLDGGRVLTSLLPDRYAYQFARIEPYGFFIILALAYFRILNFWMVPLMMAASMLLQLIVSPLNFLF